MSYKESYGRVILAVDDMLKQSNEALSKIVKAINKNDYLIAYANLEDAITSLEEYNTKIETLKTVLQQLRNAGKPLPELHMNKAVKCSYTEPEANVSCSTCINACKLTNEDADFICCNICNQVIQAKEQEYSDEQIMDTFVVHPDGHCKQHVFTENEIPYIEDLMNPQEETIVPPETPGGYVDDEHMEPEPENP